MPQGGVDEGEQYAVAAKRELLEETGVKSATLLTITPCWLPYRFPEGISKHGNIGQKQKWAAMLFTGSEEEIDLVTYAPKPEFVEWQWVDLEETVERVVPFKRDVYREVVASFAPLRDYIQQAHK